MSTPDSLTSGTLSMLIDGNKYALVVGVNNTKASSYLPDLRYAEDDAHAIYHTLRQPACNFEFLNSVLTGDKAETRDVRRAIIKLAQKKADHNFLLFYFIGHAQPMKTKEGHDDIYFVTYDFNEDEAKEDPTSHLSMRWLREMLYRPDDAGRVLIILDCCYAGNVINAGPDPFQADLRKLVQECIDGPNITQQNSRLRVLLTATGYNKPAQERIMTSLILAALQGKVQRAVDDKGHVNIHTLYTYLQDHMSDAQLPNLSGDFPRSCVLATYPEKSSDVLQQVQQAQENDRWNKVSQLMESISEVSSVITNPYYFKWLADANTRFHSQQFDQLIDEAASILDFEQEKVYDFFKRDRVQIQDDFYGGASNQDHLEHFNFLQGSHPTYGALLCFGANPTKWLSGAFTRCTLWSGNDRDLGWLEAQDYRRDLISQFELSRNFLRKHLGLIRVIGRDERSEEPEIPFVALGEALANALVHREYANQTSPMYVDIFKNRIEINSPGVPPEPMTLEILEEEHKSHPRNPQIARIFYLYGYVEKVGSGIRRMQQAMEKAELPPPKFEIGKDKTFKVTFYRLEPEKQISSAQEAQAQIPGFGSWDQPESIPKLELGWNVPVAFTSLIGREQEVKTICTLLQRPGVRLLTLTGTGGIGKTRLAIRIAEEMRKTFADGGHFVPLASVRDPNLVIPSISKVLGLKQAGNHPPLDLLKSSLRDKHLLLLLDNFEQVLPATPILSELLSDCPYLKILVTSRAVLHVQGEYEFYVPPLSLPDLNHMPERKALMEYASVALFVQRAQAIKPDFQLTEHNAHAIAGVCVMLDGLPLALELAAARIRLMSPQMLLSQMEGNRLQILTSGRGAHPARQQTLRNTLAWSYDLLTSDEQMLFRRISIFVGGCTLEALEAVSHDGDDQATDVLNTLTSLLDKSLLQQNGQDSEEQRFVMLDTVREFGLECLRMSAEAERIRRSHAEYYLARSEEAEPHLKGIQQIMWLARLDRERENLQAALELLIDDGEAELALRFCGALWWFWFLRGYWSEGRHWLEEVLGLRQAGQPTEAHVKALYGAGSLAYYQGDYKEARSMLEESVMLCRMLGIQHTLVNALGTLGMLLQRQGDFVAADNLFEESEALCNTLSSNWELSYLQGRLGQLAIQRGKVQQAAEYTQQGLMLAQTVGDKYLIASTLSTLGDIAAQQNDLMQATLYTQEVLKLAQELGDQFHIALALQNLGYYAALQGDLTQATSAQEGLVLMRDLGDRTHIAFTLYTLGYIASLQGNLKEAMAWHHEGLSLSQEVGNKVQIGLHLIGLSRVAAAGGQLERATRLLGAAAAKLDTDVSMYTLELAGYEREVEKLRTQLGHGTFAKVWNEGYVLISEQSLTVLEQASVPEVTSIVNPPPTSVYPDGLTAREVEVLRLVAQGLSNKQIAVHLVISPRTVNTHITAIYGKIQVNSRSAVTRYALEKNLVISPN